MTTHSIVFSSIARLAAIVCTATALCLPVRAVVLVSNIDVPISAVNTLGG